MFYQHERAIDLPFPTESDASNDTYSLGPLDTVEKKLSVKSHVTKLAARSFI